MSNNVSRDSRLILHIDLEYILYIWEIIDGINVAWTTKLDEIMLSLHYLYAERSRLHQSMLQTIVDSLHKKNNIKYGKIPKKQW